MNQLQALQEFARSMGTDVEVWSYKRWFKLHQQDGYGERFSDSPVTSSAGIEWVPSPKAVTIRGHKCHADVLHELGHICCTGNDTSPEQCFLGWEFVVAEKLGLLEEWFDSMRYYQIRGYNFGSLTGDRQTEWILDWISQSEKHGFLIQGEPQAPGLVKRLNRTAKRAKRADPV